MKSYSAPVSGALLLAAMCWLATAGCATPVAQTAAPASDAPAPSSGVGGPPEWRPGDRWVFGWTSGADAGTKTVEVLETREINKISFYLVRVGDLEHFYTQDLRWAGTMRDQKVESRMSPPQPWFTWPLEVGRRWTHRATYEDPTGKSVVNDTFSVVASEVVEVPAGRFSTMKIVRETERRDSDEYWYAPDVGFYVKWIGRRGDTRFEEQLRQYRPGPRLIPGGRSSEPPSKTK